MAHLNRWVIFLCQSRRVVILSGDSMGEHGCGFPLLKEERTAVIAMSLWGWGTGAPNPMIR
jgi:hypothetical protein